MGSGVEFAGNGDADVTQAPASTGQPEVARRGPSGPIEFTGDGAADVGGTIADTTPSGPMPPKGDGIVFAGNGDEDV